MIKSILLALCSLLIAAPAYSQTLTSVGLSDWDDVIAAVNEANAMGGGIISLKSRVVDRTAIIVDRRLPAITGDVIIEGNGATLQAQAGYNGSLINVQAGARLEIKDLLITGFERGLSDVPTYFSGLIDNSGQLLFERVTIADNPLCTECESSLALLVNRSRISMNNVTIFGNETKISKVIENRGHMRLINSTLSSNSVSQYECRCISMGCVKACKFWPNYESISGTWASTTEFGNTLIASQCEIRGDVIDLGGNFVPDNRCGLQPPNNERVTGYMHGSFGYHGGLVPTVGLEPGSGAIDAGNNDICSATDARFASRPVAAYPGEQPRCDAGAFEYGGAFGNADLAVNGMNGLWFSQDSDGHYVHVWRVSPDRVYVNWTAFDQSANQMWIYAVADTVNESRFSATAYFNDGIQLVPGSAPEGSVVANDWGSIEIELDSCTVGTFRYTANDNSIGSGEFQIDRLAFIEGGGCSD